MSGLIESNFRVLRASCLGLSVGLAGLLPGSAAAQDDGASAKANPVAGVSVSSMYRSKTLPDLPTGLTSFGAATVGHHLYVYGGHTGDAHQYWNESQSPVLWRLDLQKPGAWEQVGTGPRLQGLAMVAAEGRLYRLGGFVARNAKGAEQDLWSSNEFARWDESAKKWEPLAPLPEPRSSFDAAAVGSKIYVIGGWALQGDKDSTWHETAWMIDVNKPDAGWQSLPTPGFTRRALAVAALDGKIYAIGGMKPGKDGASTEVQVLDLAGGKWSAGPSLPGEGLQGFGSSAFALGDSLYATTMAGKLFRLNASRDGWEEVGSLEHPRFFLRLVPADAQHLVVVGGAHMGSGKILSQEVIAIKKK